MNYKLKKIAGDASFREFYRVKKNNKSSIIVYAKKEKYKNLIVYSLINKILNKNRISAPKLIKSFYKDSMIEISDLGDKSFFEFIKNKKNKLNHYKKLIDLIIRMQNIKFRKKYLYGKKKIKIPKYNKINLHKESDLFFDWYLKYMLNKNTNTIHKIKKKLKKELNQIYNKLYFKNEYFTHRDFHVSNIMVKKGKYGIIDSQDAILGNPLYDVASLIDDVRIKISNKDQIKLLEYYFVNSKINNEKKSKIENDFNILSVQRNLKILGIFVRLSVRDNKKNYLKFLPHTLKLLKKRMSGEIFIRLKKLMKKFLLIKHLKKKPIL